MQLTSVLLLACSTMVLATPARHRHQGEWHRSYKSGCSSPSAGASAGWNSSIPYPVGPTATVGASSAIPTPSALPSSPSEGGVTASSSSAVAPPTEPSSSPVPSPVQSATSSAAPVESSAAPVTGGGSTLTATFTQYDLLIHFCLPPLT